MIIDLRGTNGSGKSYVMHHFLNSDSNCNSIYSTEISTRKRSKPRVEAYHLGELSDILGKSTVILGSYETECGGCDGIKTADLIEQRIRQYADKYDNVMFEGITISHTVARYAKISDYYLSMSNPSGVQHDYKFCFLDTPLRTCIGRVRARRYRKDNTKPFDPDKYMGLAYDYKRVTIATKQRLIREGYDVLTIPYKDPCTNILNLLKSNDNIK